MEVQHEFNSIRHDGYMLACSGLRVVRGALLAALALPVAVAAGAIAPAASAVTPAVPVSTQVVPYLTLEQAVIQVQKQTHGKVLRAGQRRYGDLIEYRIKVLTADGHVRVVPVRTRKAAPASPPSKENR